MTASFGGAVVAQRSGGVFVSGFSRAAALGMFVRKNAEQEAATDFAALGGSAIGYTGALRVNTASFSGVAMQGRNGAAVLEVGATASLPYIGAASAHDFAIIARSGQTKFLVGGASGVSSLISSQATARIIGGANGLQARNAADTRDNLSVTDAGGDMTLNNGTYSFRASLGGAAGEWLAGAQVGGNTTSVNIVGALAGLTTGAGVVIGYVSAGATRYSAAEVFNVAAGFGTIALMRSGGNAVLGGTAAGTTANGVLAFSILATEPTASVDLVHVYGFDRSAGNRAFAVTQEAAVIAVGGAATHEWPVRINGTNYMVQLRAA